MLLHLLAQQRNHHGSLRESDLIASHEAPYLRRGSVRVLFDPIPCAHGRAVDRASSGGSRHDRAVMTAE